MLPSKNTLYGLKPSIFKEFVQNISALDYTQISNVQKFTLGGHLQGNIKVIPVKGVIFSQDNLWCWLMGGTVISDIAASFIQAMEDPSVSGIIFDISSPGGEIDGPPELAEMIYAARDKKPICAYVSRMACSAGYWIAAACSEIIIHESAEAGCIGVIASYENGDDNCINVISSISPKKVPDLNTEEGLQQVQNQVNKLGEIFLKNVAQYRGVDYEFALQNFGQGDVLIGTDALNAKLIDQVGNFRTAIDYINQQKNNTDGGSDMAEQEKTPVSAIEPDQITVDWLRENRPDLVDQIKNEGTDQEQSRQNEIDSVEGGDIPAEEMAALRTAAKSKKGFSAGDLAKQVLVAQKNFRDAKLAAVNSDASAIPTNLGGANDDQDAEKKKLLESAKKAFSRMGR